MHPQYHNGTNNERTRPVLDKSPRYNLMALGICAVLCCAWTIVVAFKYLSFQYTGWDLSLSAQIMWHLCHGSLSPSLFGGNFLVDHAHYIAFLLVPLYFFFQSALTLLVLKMIAFFAGCYILYLFAKKYLGPRWGLVFMACYIFYPGNMAMFFFEFNFENLAPPLILLTFYFLDEKRLLPFLVASLLLCLVKENMPLVAMMMGLYATCVWHKEKPLFSRLAFGLLVLGLAIFLLQLYLIQPKLTEHLSFHGSNYWEFYKKLGKTPEEILKTVFFSPQTTIPLLFREKNIGFLGELFGPLLILALGKPGILLLALPLFLQNLLSSSSGQQSIHFYYASSILVFIFLASIKTLADLKPERQKRILILISLAIFLFNASYLPSWIRRTPPPGPAIAKLERQKILSMIPKDAGVICNYKYLPWLSQRKDVYPLGRDVVSFTRKKEHIPDSVAYVLFDPSAPMGKKETVRNFLQENKWRTIALDQGLVLLQRDPRAGIPLIQIREKSKTKKSKAPVLTLGRFVRLDQVLIPSLLHQTSTQLPITYYWNPLRSLAKGVRVRISIKKDKKTVWSNDRHIVYGLPIRKEESIAETAVYTIPRLSPGVHEIHLQLTQDIRLLLKNPQHESPVFIKKIYVL